MADFEERTEQATPRRRQKAREKGQVAKSHDLSAFAGVGGILLVFSLGGSFFFDRLKGTTARFLMLQHGSEPFTVLRAASVETMVLIAPFLGVALVLSVGASVAQGGIVPRSFENTLDRLNPFNGVMQLFSLSGLTNLLKTLFKFSVGAWLFYYVMKTLIPEFPHLMGMTPKDLSAETGHLVLRTLTYGFSCFLVIGVGDYFLEQWRFERSIRMSRVEVQEEHREMEGNPLIKSRIRSVQRDMARRRMMQEVPKATVVITNPVHLAVALKYDAAAAAAPVVVAKGAEHIAARIKEIAREHGVPIVEDRPLARLLYKVDLDASIPEELYRAVAKILAYIFRLKGAAA